MNQTFVPHPTSFYGGQVPGVGLIAQAVEKYAANSVTLKESFPWASDRPEGANISQLFSYGYFYLQHLAAGEKLSIPRHHWSQHLFCRCDLNSWWKSSFGLVAETAKSANENGLSYMGPDYTWLDPKAGDDSHGIVSIDYQGVGPAR